MHHLVFYWNWFTDRWVSYSAGGYLLSRRWLLTWYFYPFSLGPAALMSHVIARNLWSLICSCLNSYCAFHLFPFSTFFKSVAFCTEFNLLTQFFNSLSPFASIECKFWVQILWIPTHALYQFRIKNSLSYLLCLSRIWPALISLMSCGYPKTLSYPFPLWPLPYSSSHNNWSKVTPDMCIRYMSTLPINSDYPN